MKHMKFLTFFFCIAFAVFACSSNNETDPNAGGIPDKEEPLATDFASAAFSAPAEAAFMFGSTIRNAFVVALMLGWTGQFAFL